jgi:hypothetical protein
MKNITNLNFLDPHKLIYDDGGNYYIVNEKRINKETQECELFLTQIYNNNLTIHNIKTTIASDENYEFTLFKNNEKITKCEFFESNITKHQIEECLFEYINNSLNLTKNL